MSVQDPASSFGAPGGAWDVAFWARARSGEVTGARTSKTRSVIKVAAPRTRFILDRTRGSPLLTGREALPVTLPYNGAAGGGRAYFAREDRPLPPRRSTSGADVVGS